MKRVLLLVLLLAGCVEQETVVTSTTQTTVVSADAALAEVDASSLMESQTDSLGFHARDPGAYSEAVGSDARIVNAGGTYFAYWLPGNWNSFEEKRVMVLLHDAGGSAYSRLNQLRPTAEKMGFGLVSVQWGWPAESGFEYMEDEAAYSIMNAALDYVELRHGADKRMSALNGFGRGAGMVSAIAGLDENLFQMHMMISGGVPDGEGWLHGDQFYMWCGTEDTGTCDDMKEDMGVLRERGAVINLFAETDGGRTLWNNNQRLQEKAAERWLNMPQS